MHAGAEAASINEFGQPIGAPVPDWERRSLPEATVITGRLVDLERLDPDRHAEDLFAAFAAAPDGRDWTYMPVGPFPSLDSYREWAIAAAGSRDPRHYAVVERASGRALGTFSLLRHDPANGAIEVGWVAFSPALQRTPASTEAQFLLMRYVFDRLGYRRYEWKCDSLNEPSRRAAERLGFAYEGTFRQAVVTKGRNRDTAWFALVDRDWPRVREGLERWLDPANFDEQGRQLRPLRTRA
ncbi:GNAT family N-acetyltransferase [Leucobacter sp. CSA1]|uniref:GNAT family N-acetyltransferase n=1 Tax=Leucobacter chromiisoli TaxID=2796471 RepID=A0A934UTZ1_9MICO|nr:GNAT family protein [Leucobacter chromiisoli]MBK0418939.1 GNAT family N-acetyltransferase [Leucobacter chromiisoli]